MKTIYLHDRNWNKIQFEYSDISELKEELESRGIRIGDGASIGINVSIGINASIGIDASIGDRASIGYGANIGYRASIGYGANIGIGASIGIDANIGIGASIGDGVNLQKNIYIKGSRHSVTYCGNNKISIGCINLDITEWLNSKEIGIEENYSEEQIKEYEGYILLIQQFVKL